MRKSRFTEAQIIGVLQAAASGAAIKAVVRRHGISEQTYSRWKAQYGGLRVDDAKRLRARACGDPRTRTAGSSGSWPTRRRCALPNLSVLKDALGQDG